MHIDPTTLAAAVNAARTTATNAAAHTAFDVAALFLVTQSRCVEVVDPGIVLIVSRGAIHTASAERCQCTRSRKMVCKHIWLARLLQHYQQALLQRQAD